MLTHRPGRIVPRAIIETGERWSICGRQRDSVEAHLLKLIWLAVSHDVGKLRGNPSGGLSGLIKALDVLAHCIPAVVWSKGAVVKCDRVQRNVLVQNSEDDNQGCAQSQRGSTAVASTIRQPYLIRDIRLNISFCVDLEIRAYIRTIGPHRF